MPEKRQNIEDDRFLIRSLALHLPSRFEIQFHAHSWPQLIYASDGVMTIETIAGAWVVPPQRAAWIPAGINHRIRMTGIVRMRTLYFNPTLDRSTPSASAVIHVTPLLRELILAAVEKGMLRETVPEDRRFAEVLLDQVTETRQDPLQVRMPDDPRARKVADFVCQDLSVKTSLSALAQKAGASIRTIERLFIRETGMTFGGWLQRVRAQHALERLAAGDSVASAGSSIAYENTSAFIAMFKKTFGKTPGTYFPRPPAKSSNRLER